MRSLRTVAGIAALVLCCSSAGALPELVVGLEGWQREALLHQGSAAALIVEPLRSHLQAGLNRVGCWVPDVPLRGDTLRLVLPPGVRLVHWAEDPARGGRRWLLEADRAGYHDLAVSYELPGLTWSVSYELNWSGSQATLATRLHLVNTLSQPLELASVSFEGRAPDAPAVRAEPVRFGLAGPLRLMPRAERAQQVAQLAGLPGQTCYESVEGQVTAAVRLEVTPDQAAWMALLPPGPLAVTRQGEEEIPPQAVGNLPGVSGERMHVNLGRTEDITARRTLLSRHKTEVEFDQFGRVSGFDTVEHYRLQLTNHQPDGALVRVWEQVLAAWELDARQPPTEIQDTRVGWDLDLPPYGRATLEFALIKHSGSRVKLVEPAP